MIVEETQNIVENPHQILVPGSLGVKKKFDAHYWLQNIINAQNQLTKDANFSLESINCMQRRRFINSFGFSIPNRQAIEAIRSYSPHGVTEIGAGLGYWTYLLNKNNIPTIGVDKYHPTANRWFSPNFNSNKKEYLSGIVVSEAVDYLATDDSEKTLLMIWPSQIEEESYADEAIAAYKGNTIIMVGEGEDGCTDTCGLFDEEETEWEIINIVGIPRFIDCFDSLTIHKRKK